MKKLLLTAALGTAALAYGTAANAAATISLEALNTANAIIGSIGPVSGGSATIGGNASGFTFSVTAFGVPTVPSPDFATTTIDANAAGAGILTILATQQGLTGFPSGTLGNTFAGDFLINNQNVASIVMTNYVDAGNVAFGTGTQLATTTCLGATNNCAPATILANVSGLTTFSETEKFVITFTGGAGISANSQIATVPEPATWGMLLLGFAGLAFAFRRSRRKVSFA
jgi:PEP-CTERM motif